MLDKNRLIFGSKMMEVVQKDYLASCDSKEGQLFVDTIYKEYLEQNSPKNTSSWLRSTLKNYYLHVTSPPIWIEEEPEWPYLNGQPMVFISQTILPNNPTTSDHLTWDVVVYLFGGRIPHPHGFKVEYKIIEQVVAFNGKNKAR
jgi:hypothetical protein